MSFTKVYDGSNAITLKGHWTACLYGEDGSLKQEVSGYNVITDNGKEFLANFLSSASTGASTFTMRYIAVGTDSTAEAASNTALGTEISRHTGTASYGSGAIYSVVATFAAGSGTGAIVEYGLFSTSNAGTMLARDVEAVINKGASDTLSVTYNVTLL